MSFTPIGTVNPGDVISSDFMNQIVTDLNVVGSALDSGTTRLSAIESTLANIETRLAAIEQALSPPKGETKDSKETKEAKDKDTKEVKDKDKEKEKEKDKEKEGKEVKEGKFEGKEFGKDLNKDKEVFKEKDSDKVVRDKSLGKDGIGKEQSDGKGIRDVGSGVGGGRFVTPAVVNPAPAVNAPSTVTPSIVPGVLNPAFASVGTDAPGSATPPPVQHFIPSALRPDLASSALNREPEGASTPDGNGVASDGNTARTTAGVLAGS